MGGLRRYCGPAAIAVLALGLVTAGAVRAEDAAPADASDQTAAESMFDVAFGIAVTSNYVSRGITQTEDKPAVQATSNSTRANSMPGRGRRTFRLAARQTRKSTCPPDGVRRSANSPSTSATCSTPI
jgi:Bacterial protein of unknown function (Gcw_chp)